MIMRYNEQAIQPSKKVEEKKERELVKPGKYSSKELENTKNVPWRK